MFYDGNLAEETGLKRVADSFIRFGNFEIFSAREDIDGLRTLLTSQSSITFVKSMIIHLKKC